MKCECYIVLKDNFFLVDINEAQLFTDLARFAFQVYNLQILKYFFVTFAATTNYKSK